MPLVNLYLSFLSTSPNVAHILILIVPLLSTVLNVPHICVPHIPTFTISVPLKSYHFSSQCPLLSSLPPFAQTPALPNLKHPQWPISTYYFQLTISDSFKQTIWVFLISAIIFRDASFMKLDIWHHALFVLIMHTLSPYLPECSSLIFLISLARLYPWI